MCPTKCELQAARDLPGQEDFFSAIGRRGPKRRPKDRNAVWNTDVSRCAATKLPSMWHVMPVKG